MVKKVKGKYKIYQSVSKELLIAGLVVIIIAFIFFAIRCFKEYSFTRLDPCILLVALLLIDLYFIIKPPKDKLVLEMDNEKIEYYYENGKIKDFYFDDVKEFRYVVTDAINDVIVIYKDEQKDPENIRLSGITKFKFVNIANNIIRQNYLDKKESNFEDEQN